MTKELDEFVVADEKVKEELNRRPKLEKIKEKHNKELEESFEILKKQIRTPKQASLSSYRSRYLAKDNSTQ